ncbi:hypothetical protein BJV78DRAFT_1251707 [Lactifluus subvellereus]|nr:hypothetical protein BJV78DRAFT_1251707 [Lactifluus subvellereus]
MPLTTPPSPSPSPSSQPTMLGYRLTLPLTLSYLLISLTRAQPDFPPCVAPCLQPALQASGCNINDDVCLCTNPVFAQVAGTCVQNSCSASDAQAALNLFHQLCGMM